MVLDMKPGCEACGVRLALDSYAFICSYECTFCPTCSTAMQARCPNCGGELLQRPRRQGANPLEEA